MYLRKNRIGSGASARTYVAIAHSIWCRLEGKKPQSRPVIVANLGPADEIDLEVAHHLATVLDQLVLPTRRRRGNSPAVVTAAVAELRQIEPFLRLLVRPNGGMARKIPQGSHCVNILTDLVRARLATRTDGSAETRSVPGDSPLEAE